MDIALIGLSLKAVDINTLQQFIDLLRNEEVRMVQPTAERILYSKIQHKGDFHPYGYLDRVDFFDHEFFNLSKGEANAIDPGHRMLLESVCQAIENSGYSLEDSSLQDAGLFTTAQAGVYNLLYQSKNSELDFVGGISSIGGGRVANILNIRGPVFNIDTACSSSLVAVHEAVQYINSGAVNTAIVAGSHLLFMFNNAGSFESNAIMSSDGICRAFDSEASGTAGGEGVAAIVLKRLDHAIRDNDNILTVIKGSAINNDGNRSSSITAPSPAAQKNVILDACEKANIPVTSVGYIETHGTGTKLGDPIEYKGIKDAFSSTDEEYAVRLGTLKPNIGHLDNMAGLFGFIKAAAVLKEKEFFPLANFSTVNKFIEENDNIVLEKKGSQWLSDKPRRAGVSSFGLSGTNAHVILEEYVSEKEQLSLNANNTWFKIAAKSKNALKQYIENIYNFITEDTEIRNLAYTLSTGRADYKYRLAVKGNSIEELKQSLLEQKENIEQSNTARFTKIALLYLSDEVLNLEHFLSNSEFNTIFEKQQKEIDGNGVNPSVLQTLAFQTSLFNYLSEKGFKINQLICNGSLAKVSKAIIDGNNVIPTDLSFEVNAELDFEKLKGLAKSCNENNTLLVLVGNSSLLENIIATLQQDHIPGIDLLKTLSDKNWNSLWSTLYNNGLGFDWKKFYANEVYQKVAAPTYPFEKISCWNEIVNPLLFGGSTPTAVQAESKPLAQNANEEEIVVAMLQEVLQNTDIKLTDDFFELGGNSIVGVQFINRINETFDIEIVFDDLFNCYEINDIIALIKEEAGKNTNKAVADKEDKAGVTVFEASNSQQRMWIESQIESYYNIDLSYTVKGAINIDVFKQTLLELVKKHASLRSFFTLDENGLILQKVKETADLNIDDLFFHYAETNATLAEEKRTEFKNFQFDLENGPLFKAAIIESGQEDAKLIFVFHHIIFDGWSIGVFVKDFVTLYQQLVNQNYSPEANKSDYFDYLVWLRENLSADKTATYRAYWQNKLKNANTKLQLGNTNTTSANGARVNYTIDSTLRQKLNELATTNRTTLFTILIASVRTFLYKLAQENFVIGTPVSGRVKKEFESTIGLFINTLPIYTEINGEQRFTDCLTHEKASVNKALEYQIYPYDLILNDLNVADKKSFFDVLVVLQNQDSRSGLLTQNDLPFEILPDTNQASEISRFNLSFAFFEVGDTIELELEYKTAVFSSEFIDSMITSFAYALEQFTALPEQRIADIAVINQEQFNMLVYEFNDTKADYPQDKTIITLFEEQVQKTPNAIALVFEEKQLTYQELNEQANQFGHYLRKNYSIVADDLIGIRLDRSERMIVSILGILKSGAAYVPIDNAYPEERIAFIEKDTNCKIVVDDSTLQQFDEVSAEYAVVNPENINQPNDLAYVIYTSGTTGNPKGVMVEQGNVVRLVKPGNYFPLNEEKVLLSTGSISFDATTVEYFGTLLNGAKLVLVRQETQLELEELANVIQQNKVNSLWMTASWFNQVVENKIELFETITQLIVGGDIVSPIHVQKLYDQYPAITIVNGYGPTENTTFSTTYEIKPAGYTAIPIGKPIENSQAYLLDSNLQPVNVGVSGKLYVAGAGVARGYLNNLELTAEKFIDNPFVSGTKMYNTGDLGRWLPDGNIEFLGRNDQQVKIRGFRIELGEIETSLLQFSAEIGQAVVEVKELNNQKVLVAYYTTQSEIDKTAIKGYLQSKLPEYMVPSFYVVLENMPLTANGKTDRKALPDISGENVIRKEYVEPRNETEQQLATIWQEVLGLEKVGATDSFFELGGHSLNATKLISVIHKQFNVKLSIVDLFNNITLEELALFIENTIAYSTNTNEDVSIEETEDFTV
ncbi:hypothetical protein B4N84_02120 [Flavobacterium sp. IR1]|nr:hypothetical protein B4N84_02120 [Flavobacterium sp. IR1]